MGAAFDLTGSYSKALIVVERFEASNALSIGWSEYEVTGDKEVLASKQPLFFRAVFMPSLALALTRVRNGDEDAMIEFADRLQEGMIQRLALNPAPMDSYAHVIVLAKCE